jgi:hypothetical protein
MSLGMRTDFLTEGNEEKKQEDSDYRSRRIQRQTCTTKDQQEDNQTCLEDSQDRIGGFFVNYARSGCSVIAQR